MKFSIHSRNATLLAAGLLFAAVTRVAFCAEPSAFDLIKKADEYVGKDAKDQVVQIRSEKSIGTLTPTIWYVVFYDPDATFKATEVKFGAGEKLAVTRPFRVLELPKADHVFDMAKLKVDSNQAIKIATSEPLLENLKIKATQLWLDANYKMDFSISAPIWRVRLWAAELSHPNRDVDIGQVFISADEGKVLKSDLHIDRVD